MKLYGSSDIEVIKLSDGHQHSFIKAAQRVAAPGFGDDERSLPVVDCALCAEWCIADGWAKNPKKVMQTADEQDYVRESKEQGSMYMRGLLEGVGRGVGAKTEETAARRTSRVRR
jgi:hypothetical protein